MHFALFYCVGRGYKLTRKLIQHILVHTARGVQGSGGAPYGYLRGPTGTLCNVINRICLDPKSNRESRGYI